MSDFTVVRAGREEAGAFSNHFYRVHAGDRCVAELSHTYRGDEHFLRKPGGDWRPTDRLIEGGGPQPLSLSKAGIKAIEGFLAD